jgi:hypothetical protein
VAIAIGLGGRCGALLARAMEDERRGDEDVKQASAWSDRQAGERYRDALEDLARSCPAIGSP